MSLPPRLLACLLVPICTIDRNYALKGFPRFPLFSPSFVSTQTASYLYGSPVTDIAKKQKQKKHEKSTRFSSYVALLYKVRYFPTRDVTFRTSL